MKCILLCAGYATRLYPLTENLPKPLLEVKGKSIIDWLIDDLAETTDIDEYIIVTNHKFVENFVNYKNNKKNANITVVDDLTLSNEDRLGAVMDINFAVKKLNITDDVLVVAGDNVLDFSLSSIVNYGVKHNASTIFRYYEEDINRIKRAAYMVIDESDRVLDMVEKPENPLTHWCCPPFYFYKNKDVRRIEEAVQNGCGKDSPGNLAAWLSKNSIVYAMEMPGKRFDIGNLDSYKQVQEIYEGILRNK